MERTFALTAAGMLASASALVAIATPATGPAGSAHPPGPVSHENGVDSRAEQDSVRAIWTRSRMKAAIPRGEERPAAKPGGGGSPGTSAGRKLGTAWSAGRVTVGKVF